MLNARQGGLSIRELVRRSRAAAALEAQTSGEARKRDLLKAAQDGSKLICDWLETEGWQVAFGVPIINEARRHLAMAEEDGKLPISRTQPDTPVAKIIERLRPDATIHEDIGSVGWYAAWLARWAYFVMPYANIRHKALNIVLDKQISG